MIQDGRTSVVPHLQELTQCLATNIHVAFEKASTGIISVRICKYLLNTTMLLFAKRTLVEFVTKDNVKLMADQLLQRLLDSSLPNLSEGQQLLQALNTLMLKLLENTNRTHAYTALLHLLSENHEDASKIRYVELVVKCLLKLTKALHSTIDRLQIDIILADLHEFLTTNPPTRFKENNDLPLRTVKTILNELVKSLGLSIRSHMSLIPTHKNPLIVSYIELMLTSQQSQSSSSSTSLVNKAAVQQEPNVVSSDVNQGDELEVTLTQIFSLIGSKDTTQKGLINLHKFRKQYGTERMQDHLSRCSEPFQKYILRQLSKLEAHEMSTTPSTNTITTTTTGASVAAPVINTSQSVQLPAPRRTVTPTDRNATTVRSSDSVASIINRIKGSKAALSDPSSSAINGTTTTSTSTNTSTTTTTSSSDIEAIRRRIRAKQEGLIPTDANNPTNSTDVSSGAPNITSQNVDFGNGNLRARMIATISRIKQQAPNTTASSTRVVEKENVIN
ncbi:hypothetical protein AKO1_011206 [Acrasis kona]|uniref:Cytoskeleton-associated protein 5 n=1 Tax=Acrasis kona TaxID=1008807 RepID=A0AAW2YVQ0_9EUKA